MSRLPIVLTSLLLLPGIAVAQIIAPDCSIPWQMMFNSLGQNACTVAAYLMATCTGGMYDLPPLSPGGTYTGPDSTGGLTNCSCSTITYSLFSACELCQQGTTIPWSNYAANCTTIFDSSFPNPVPSGTRVPHWTVLDVTRENKWDSNMSFTDQHAPEYLPGTLINGTTSATPTPTTSVTTALTTSVTTALTTSPTTHPSPALTHGSSSNSGAIAGGVVSGVVVVAVAGLAIFWLRRKCPQAPSAAPRTPMKLYDPDDPTTFPGFHGAGQVQTSGPQGYHGLPIV